jgi:SpoIID/LytB domain protein
MRPGARALLAARGLCANNDVASRQRSAGSADECLASSIRSTLLDVVANGREFRFSGNGFGHGVGLRQAARRTRDGRETPRAVLMHYYPGTSLTPSSCTRQD